MDHDHASEPSLVLIAHGSRAVAANTAHVELCAALSVALARPVTPAFLELAEPDLATAIESVVADGATSVLVLPYFLHPGNHTGRDIPALVDAARARHREVEIATAPLFGADPALVDVLVAQARRAADPTTP